MASVATHSASGGLACGSVVAGRGPGDLIALLRFSVVCGICRVWRLYGGWRSYRRLYGGRRRRTRLFRDQLWRAEAGSWQIADGSDTRTARAHVTSVGDLRVRFVVEL